MSNRVVVCILNGHGVGGIHCECCSVLARSGRRARRAFASERRARLRRFNERDLVRNPV